MDKVTLIRSVYHTMKNHNSAGYYALSGSAPPSDDQRLRDSLSLFPAYGSVVDKLAPGPDDVPTFISYPHVIADGSITPGQHASFLGKAHDPLFIPQDPNAKDFAMPELSLPANLPYERVTARRELQKLIDVQARMMDYSAAAKGLDSYYERALAMLHSPKLREAFNLSSESDAVRDSYGRTTYGQSCLLARRLVEAGVKFVTVGMPNWDTHTYNCKTMKEDLLPVLDNAYAALLQDLQDRRMLDSTLVVCMGEFGRTPKINAEAGRDHWPSTQVVALGGGGIKTGLIVGATNARSEYPIERPLSVQDLGATIYHALGIPTSLEYTSTVSNRPIKVLDSGEPIAELI
jgi:hypothetical protein